MKIQILSDIHNEISQFDPIQTDADVLVLAGDIGRKEEGIRWAVSAFHGKQIVYVPGNHEFYHGMRETVMEQMRCESIGGLRLNCVRSHAITGADYSRVHFLENDEIIIRDVRFLGCTLWTDFMLHGEAERPYSIRDGKSSLADFRLIRENESRMFTPGDAIRLHKESLEWLQDRLNEKYEGKTVVVTHHLPSIHSVAECYKDSLLSACFASHLDHLFDGRIDLWIHGHTHDSVDYILNGTRVICNPRGYVTHKGIENLEFNPRMVVEI